MLAAKCPKKESLISIKECGGALSIRNIITIRASPKSPKIKLEKKNRFKLEGSQPLSLV
jgi:hypothetical protein